MRDRFFRSLCLPVALFLCGPAFSATLQSKPSIAPTSNGAKVSYDGGGTAYPSSRTYSRSGDTGLVIDAITGEILSKPVTLSSSRGAGMDKMIPAARMAGKALKYVQLAQTAADLYSILKDAGFDKDPATDGVLYDPGQDQTQGVKYTDKNGTNCGSSGSLNEVLTCSANAACASDVKQGYKSCTWVEKSRSLSGTLWTVTVQKHDLKSDGTGYYINTSLYFLQETTLICPQYSLAPLTKILGSGLCHSDNRLPADDSLIETAIRAEPTVTPDRLIKALDTAGQDVSLSSPSLSGPSSIPSSTKTTTNPDGTTTTTITVNNLTYQGDTVTISNTTTTTTNPDGSTTTTTDDQAKSQCEINPAAAGCGGSPAPAGTLYAKKDRTFQSVLTAGRDAILATPLGSAMGNFFTIAGGGSCPIWTWNIGYIKAVVVVDEFCTDWAISAYAVIKGAVLIIFAWVAFRWAVL